MICPRMSLYVISFKKIVHQSVSNSSPQIDAENVKTHVNFCLVNVLFVDEMI